MGISIPETVFPGKTAPEGPFREQAVVMRTENVAEQVVLVAVSPQIARTITPGQFVSIPAPERSGPPDRWMLSPSGVEQTAAGAGIRLVLAANSPLAGLPVGAVVDLIGPLGSPIAVPQPGESTVFVGIDHAAATAEFAAEYFRAHELSCTPVRYTTRAVPAIVSVATAPALLGDPDDWPEKIRKLLVESGADKLIIAGPTRYARSAAEVAAQLNVECDVLVEPFMACGVGLCLTCVIPVNGSAAGKSKLRACIDGPSFAAKDIDWDELDPAPRESTALATTVGKPGAVPDLTAEIGKLILSNPIVLSSGTVMYGREISNFLNLSDVGAVVTKSALSRAWLGNGPKRGAATPSGMLNSIGLQGDGIDAMLTESLPFLEAAGARTIISLAGHSVEEFAESAAKLTRYSGRFAAVELNISCPNVGDQNRVFARYANLAADVVRSVRAELPDSVLFTKLSPDVADIVEVAHACVEAGTDGLSMINTVLGAAIDMRTLRPKLSNIWGGLSGPAIRPVAVRCIWQVHAALPHVPIIGGGGVRTGLDALELTVAGASAISIGTVSFGDPHAAQRIIGELAQALDRHGIISYRDAVGLAHHGTG